MIDLLHYPRTHHRSTFADFTDFADVESDAMAEQEFKNPPVEVGKYIRAELKKRGIKNASVRKRSYTSVYVNTTDLTPRQVEIVQQICKKYELGHFDGSIDLYQYDNRNDDIPQVRHVIVQNSGSDRMYQKVWDMAREKFGLHAFPPSYRTAHNDIVPASVLPRTYQDVHRGIDVALLVGRLFRGQYPDFWPRKDLAKRR